MKTEEKVEPTLTTFPKITEEEPEDDFEKGKIIMKWIEDVHNWEADFEASQRKNLEKLRVNDKRSVAVRRALIDYIERKVLGIKRNTLGEEILG